MLLIRPLVGDEAFERVRAMVDATERLVDAIVRVREALPQDADLLRLDLDRRVAALPESEQREFREKLQGYLDAHPDVASALGVAGGDGA